MGGALYHRQGDTAMRDLKLRPTETGTDVTEDEKAEWRKSAEPFLKTELDDAEQAQHKTLKKRKFSGWRRQT